MTQIVGILNITSDSFSDGGRYFDTDSAISWVDFLSQNGADIIELSSQSSNIHSLQIPDKLEWERIYPILQYCQTNKLKISVDTYKPYVIQKCIESQVDYINSINSFRDELSQNILKELSSSLPELILMYSQNKGDTAISESKLTRENVLNEIVVFFEKKLKDLEKINISKDKIIVDPGMGLFLSPDPDISIHVLKNINTFKEKFQRVMVSVSRKSFIGALCDSAKPIERSGGTLACENYLIEKGVDFIRTHDPRQIRQFIHLNSILRN